VEDRERVAALVGRKVAVNLHNVEASGVELIATLDEVREDGIWLSEIGELGPGPMLFCPWDSLRQVRERPPWLRPPHEEPPPDEATGDREFYHLHEVIEVPEEEIVPETFPERREASARTLERVVPVVQKQTVGGITVALTSLELYGEGVGVLRWRISHHPVSGVFMLEPDFEIRDGSGRVLPWSPRGAGASDTEVDGEIEVRSLPESGTVVVVASRVASGAWDEDEEGPSYDGPWTFRFSI
jgi:hypothetical protein